MSGQASNRLSDEELGALLRLVEHADSVELKLTVPHSDHAAAAGALGIDPLGAHIRQVFFFDTPDLSLSKAGVVVRARRVQGKGDDSVVKLRPVIPHELPRKLWDAPGFGVEVDAMPGGYVCSASMKARAQGDVRETLADARPLRKLFSKEQRAFFAEHAPEGVQLDDLAVMGPIFVLKLKTSPKGFPTPKLVSEAWLYPDGTRILELSTKCPPAEMFDTALRARTHLAGLGVNLSGEQQTKTKTALEFFSAQSG